MKALFTKVLATFILVSFTAPMLASSTGGYRNNTTPKKVDQAYEHGKAVYQGRIGTRYKYCIDNGAEKVKLKGSSAKVYKGKSAKDFAVALYDCNNTDVQIASKLNGTDLSALIYYFNKRYRLKMTGI